MRVLLATDGSDSARAATAWLSAFPLPPSAELLVVTVVVAPAPPVDVPSVRILDQALLDTGRRTVDDARTVVARQWPSVETQVLAGDPREVVIRAAADWNADLVVLGARGLGAVASFVLGSVSTTVAREASCPVLIAKERRPGLENVLMAIDGSPDSLAAVRYFAALPIPATTRLRLVAVAEPPVVPYAAMPLLSDEAQAELDRRVGQRWAELDTVLASVEEELRGSVNAIERTVVVGRPREEIVAAAREHGIDLVVMGARGVGPIERLLLGSVSERVLHQAECPVLIIKRRSR